ncbi:MAG: T9SS type A sorting domain-containing protein [Ignavibacteriaceae bacterium]|nr:T9SS type A sorting domain-containing protein [Ignavibacteriaceae bacterium]
MKKFVTIFLLLFLAVTAAAQSLRVEKPVFTKLTNDEFGSDRVILNHEPSGKMSGIQMPGGDIYLAVADTLSTQNLGLVIIKSTDGGASWAIQNGVAQRGAFGRIKLIKTGTDSLYCFFQYGTSVYSWNVNSSIINHTGGTLYRTFDVQSTSSNSIYLIVDSLTNNDTRLYASTNGGYTWINRIFLSSTAVLPRMDKSLSGDTLYISYYGVAIQPDTSTSAIRFVRYRETAPGIISSAGFQTLITNALPKKEFRVAGNNGEIWLLYTLTSGVSELWAKRSTDGGVTFGTDFRINPNETINQYWFDITSRYPEGNGFDLIYYADSAQTGPATIATDMLKFSRTAHGSGTFPSFFQINDFPAVLSTNEYMPVIVQLPVLNNTGVAWVGETPSGKALFWDSYVPVPVEFISFSGMPDGSGSIMLSWSTGSEKNNLGFDVEKLAEGKWNKIGFVDGRGTSLQINNYSFTDANITGEKNIYRLKQIDYDGTVSLSGTIEVDLSGEVISYELQQNYPNPFNPSTTIAFTIPEPGHVTVTLFDVQGNEVKTLFSNEVSPGKHIINFNAEGLASGVYIYKIHAGNFTSPKKLMLMK